MKLKFSLTIKHILLVSLLLWLPLLTIRGFFWDSWVVLWDYTNGGILKLLDIAYQVGHAGWSLPYIFFFENGENYAGELGRATAISFHLINSYLFYLILYKNKIWKEFALLASAIYTLSPFYTARISINLAPYDIFIACYLASILLMHRSGIISKIVGYLLLIISFSWETLMALEVLRIIYLYEGQKDWKNIIKKVSPAWLLCIIFTVLRFTILKPHGLYEGYNSISLPMFLHLPEHIIEHLIFYIEMLGWNLKIVTDFLTIPAFIVLSLLSGFIFWKYKFFKIPGPNIKLKQKKIILYLSITFFIISVAPYAIIGRVPGLNFGNRLVGAAPFAVVLGISLMISRMHNKKFQSFLVGGLLFIFVTFLFCSNKWAIYDDLIKRDIQRQLQYYYENTTDDTLAIIKMSPPEREILYQESYLFQGYTLVPTALWNNSNVLNRSIYGSELENNYTTKIGKNKNCSTIYSTRPCPKKRVVLEYQLLEKFKNFNRISYIELIKMSLFRKYDDNVMGDMYIISDEDKTKMNFLPLLASPQNQLIKRIQGY